MFVWFYWICSWICMFAGMNYKFQQCLFDFIEFIAGFVCLLGFIVGLVCLFELIVSCFFKVVVPLFLVGLNLYLDLFVCSNWRLGIPTRRVWCTFSLNVESLNISTLYIVGICKFLWIYHSFFQIKENGNSFCLKSRVISRYSVGRAGQRNRPKGQGIVI